MIRPQQTECYTCGRQFIREEYADILCRACSVRWKAPVAVKAKVPPPPQEIKVSFIECAGSPYLYNGTSKRACNGTCPVHGCSSEHGCFCK